ncbi:MAG: 30S ribosomal protein S21 [Spirochaetes bacterium]|nr:30S ribosomal protein S21 [Spirochaetota bacterium]
MARVFADDNEPVELVIKRFKRECEREGIIREWRKKEFYEKPSEIRKQKKKALERKLLKKQRKNQQGKKSKK